jgi:hypothetical protein
MRRLAAERTQLDPPAIQSSSCLRVWRAPTFAHEQADSVPPRTTPVGEQVGPQAEHGDQGMSAVRQANCQRNPTQHLKGPPWTAGLVAPDAPARGGVTVPLGGGVTVPLRGGRTHFQGIQLSVSGADWYMVGRPVAFAGGPPASAGLGVPVAVTPEVVLVMPNSTR